MKDNNDNDGFDKKILSLLKDFYKPEQNKAQEESSEAEEFEVFYRKIQDKIENDTVHKKVSSGASELEYQYLNRQQRLFQAKNRFESGFFEKKENKFKARKLVRNALLMGASFVFLTLAGIATFKHNDAYKVINFEAKEKAWNDLELNSKQKTKLTELERQWQSYMSFELEKIHVAKAKLQKEINKVEPDFSLINKYQREIFDLEQNLEKQKFNSELEKRFVLNQDQSLQLVRQN